MINTKMTKMDNWIVENLGEHHLVRIIAQYDVCKLDQGEYSKKFGYWKPWFSYSRRCNNCCFNENSICYFSGRNVEELQKEF